MRLLLPIGLALLLGCEATSAPPDPGEFVLHRLNRAEYDNTVRDLLASELTPAKDFPADDFGFGFDHISSVLSLSPLHLELYERAAEQLLTAAWAPPTTYPLDLMVEAEDGLLAQATAGFAFGAGFWNLNVEGSLVTTVQVPVDGSYLAGARAFGHLAGDEPARMEVRVDGELLGSWEVTSVAGDAAVYGAELPLSAGAHELEVSYVNEFSVPATGADRNLLVDRLGFSGPLDQPSPPALALARVLPCDPATGPRTCAALAIHTLAERAWRRPVSEPELLGPLAIYDQVVSTGDPFELGVQQAQKAVLLSPHFVFRVERDADVASEEPHPLDPFELASRLSYFLWSSMPDDALFAAARAGELETDAQLAAQVQRMLADPRSEALVDNFAGQWLYIRAISDAAPDGATWPDFDLALRGALEEEMRLFFRTFMDEDRPMTELVTARETFLNHRLVHHYELDGLRAPLDDFVRVGFSGSQRGAGVLTQGGLLAATSYPLRTSPTRRGKWILEQLLCSAPPPPPPGVEGLEEGGAGDAVTVREKLEAHVANPTCASCHVDMDAYGFAMEHFDPVGVWRETDAGQPIDATAELDGVPFDGVLEMAQVLGADRSLTRCMAQQLNSYALARGPQSADWPLLNAIHGRFEEGGFRFPALVEAIVLSPGFRSRRGGQALVQADGAPVEEP